ncbi:MAG: hypothetical protein N4A40_13705 [Tissierellales bacterium]|jgi:hypothetical protein|nr:hypothetical protein [Tissierellales bacterium]
MSNQVKPYNNYKNKIKGLGLGFFNLESITIDAIIYDMFDEFADGVVAYPKKRPQDRAGILSDGNLYMENIDPNETIVFTYFGEIIHEIAAINIGAEFRVDKSLGLDPVHLSNEKPKKDNRLIYIGLGLLGLILAAKAAVRE